MEAGRLAQRSVEDYLVFEQSSPIRHEWVAGEPLALEAESVAHNTIAGNIFAALHARLRGGPCRVFFENVKLRLEVAREELFYYPDVVVSCHPTGIEKLFVRWPTLVVEVLSPSTENTDRREKKMIYQEITTLQEYVLVAQDRREVTIFRRAQNWVGESVTAADATVEFRSLQQSLTLAEIYEDVF